MSVDIISINFLYARDITELINQSIRLYYNIKLAICNFVVSLNHLYIKYYILIHNFNILISCIYEIIIFTSIQKIVSNEIIHIVHFNTLT